MSGNNEYLKKELQDSYNLPIRIFEIVSILLNIALTAFLLIRFNSFLFESPLYFFSILVGSWLLADFASGLVHWFADTWGRLHWPVIGNLFIRSFKEHHIDPLSITRHDAIETNGANFSVAIPVLIICLFADPESSLQAYLVLLFLFTNLWTASTNQIHKWAHQTSAPKMVEKLQKLGLILSPEDHNIHHRGEFDKHYCITNGRLNRVLERIGFFKKLESLIIKSTGVPPRQD